ncbi:WD repeat-containing protein 47 [Phytophthora pseudosyringae]|uniref:WD repeat-containing protein 47 n=1 Tax=Phytophthora pseudosyringae TaxID=221518 RepID=A0A8T1VZ80_9STRA|nr:WD repeat-containing protein 47 [Phytophthora pseudosyringae]
MSSTPQHTDVLYLVAQYLQAKGFFASSLALQQESGLDVTWLRGSSREVALLRRWVFAGDVQRARALLQPLASLSDVSKEMQAALLALDELEVLMKTPSRGGANDPQQSRLAKAKLRCFETLVPLFRAPVGEGEGDVFKYVAAPKTQLVGLIHDAVLFHRQTGDDTARDCISVTCGGKEEEAAEGDHGHSELLLLDEPHGEVSLEEYDFIPTVVESVARSVEWTRWRRKRRNPMALSVNLSNRQWLEEGSGGEDEFDAGVDEEERFFIPDVKETADAAVNCDLDVQETFDAAVSCELDVKETADAAVSCRPDVKQTADVAVSCRPKERQTADAAVSCGPNEWSDVATQTENLQYFYEKEEEVALGGDGKAERNQSCEPQSYNSSTIAAQANFEKQQEEPRDQNQRIILSSSISSSKQLTASWARKSLRSSAIDAMYAPEVYPGVDLPKQKAMVVEDAPPPGKDCSEDPQQDLEDDTEFDPEMTLLRGPPQHYDDLKLEHAVCASVIAEVKELQAVRALDVHPSGAQLAVGTNARALRLFDLSTPLQQRQEQLSWSSPLNSILPLLPVVLEKHKHHDSGIYCVSYNHYLRHAGATSMIASGAADGSVKVLVTRDKEDPLQRQQTDQLWIQRGDINGSMGKTRALEFASPHHLWTTSTNDLRLCCWDVRRTHRSSSSGPFQTLDGHVGEIQAIAMPHPSASGYASTSMLSAALDKTVRLWDTRSRRCERLVTSGAHSAFSLHFHPTDEKLVVSGHQDGSVSLWDLRSTAREALQVVMPHQDECRSVRWSPGGQWLLSSAFDGTLCIMQASASSLQPVASYHKHYGKVLQAQWHPTEPAFVSSGADKRVKLWAFA